MAAAFSKALNVLALARSNTGVLSSNPTQDKDVFMCLFCVYVVSPWEGLIPRLRSNCCCVYD
jgi:hypothetical protein